LIALLIPIAQWRSGQASTAQFWEAVQVLGQPGCDLGPLPQFWGAIPERRFGATTVVSGVPRHFVVRFKYFLDVRTSTIQDRKGYVIVVRRRTLAFLGAIFS
jgi:hypothetical protein